MSTYEISKSSLLSLKAEILKKQEELNKAKIENKVKLQKEVKKGPLEFKNKGVENRRALDVNSDDEDLHVKSRKALEAKSKLYDKLIKGAGNQDDVDEDQRYLVQFNKKSKEKTVHDTDEYPESDVEEPVDYNDYKAENSDEEWVEYTDCFGRTRTCLKKDLPTMKAKDKDIQPEFKNDDTEKQTTEDAVSESADFNETSELLSGDMRRELMRQQWEKEEAELMDKKNVHYQDVLFSEARSHGVGYYAFSKDEETREKQQEALNKLRQETQEQQKQAQEIKRNREKQLKTRILAAQNRKRARMGLPPLELDDETDEKPAEEKQEEPKKQLTEEDLTKEREKAAARKRHVRPWDIGKEGVKEHVEYTQEEWVDIQRKKRDDEFAPPRSYNSTVKDIPEPSESENKGLYFSSKRTRKEDEFKIDTSKPPPQINNPARGFVNPYKSNPVRSSLNPYKSNSDFTPTPIEDESVDEDEDEGDRLLRDYENIDNKRGGGVEVAPPPTYEYYGPSGSSGARSNNRTGSSIEESIMEGLKFLREKVEEKKFKKRH